MAINIQYNENSLLKIQTQFVQRLKLHQKAKKKVTTLRSPLHAPLMFLLCFSFHQKYPGHFLSLFDVFLVHDRLLLLL